MFRETVFCDFPFLSGITVLLFAIFYETNIEQKALRGRDPERCVAQNTSDALLHLHVIHQPVAALVRLLAGQNEQA